jgi:hypothetical protein
MSTSVAAAVLLVWCAFVYGYWVLVDRRLTVVSRNTVFQAGAMRAQVLRNCVARLRIDTVIDFRGSHKSCVTLERATLDALGVRHVNIPTGREPTPADVARFVDVMQAERRAGRRVLMHCKDGQGRAVAFAAIYRIEFDGWSPRAAYRASVRLPPSLRFLRFPFPFLGRLSPHNPKTRMILDYVPFYAGRPITSSPIGTNSVTPVVG